MLEFLRRLAMPLQCLVAIGLVAGGITYVAGAGAAVASAGGLLFADYAARRWRRPRG